jgi:hypothetical protein
MNTLKYKKIILSLLLLPALLLLAPAAHSQEVIDEDFIDLLQKNAKAVWDEADADFSVSTIPDKWKNESGVVMAYKEHVLFDKQRRGLLGGKADLLLLEKKRMKIKLQDKSSVNDFSQLYFRYSDKIDGFGAVVYKADGSKKELTLNKAVSIEDNDNVPDFFKSFFDRNISRRNEYYKVPVNDLVPGDILEFVAITSSKFSVKNLSYYMFDPDYELCNKGVPMMQHKIIIETDNNSFITAKSLNGAPEFQQSTNGDFIMYSWTDRDRDRVKDVNFVNEFMVLPMVKYQIVYTNGNENKSLFAGGKGSIKTEFEAKEIGTKAFDRYGNTGGSYVYGAGGATIDALTGYLYGKMKKMDAKDMSDEEYIKLAYYMIRHTQVFSNFYYTDKQFAYLLKSLLNKQRIESDIIVSTPNNLTQLKDLLFEDELTWCLRVKDKYIFQATEHSNIYEVNEKLMGNDGYRLPENRKETTEAVKIIETTPADNLSRYEITSGVDSAFRNLSVVRTSTYKGISKEKSAEEAMHLTPYVFEDYKTYNGTDDADDWSSKSQDDYFNKRKAIKDEYARLKPEYMKNQAERDFGADVNYTNFEIVTDGRSTKKNELKFKETFTVSDKIRKAGKKYLVNVCGLMGGQLQIKKDERERTFDIDVRYPRTLQWLIQFTIPQGYTLEGVDNLISEVDNESGTFKTNAKIENNVLIVSISKVYKKKNISKAKWPEMLAFVDAAYNFGHKLVLLKPANP